ncbi:ABIL1-like protein [Drosera capensis]
MEVEVEEARPGLTFDEASMERSKNFVKALQELKNLRPQLYSAAEYCEKSYLNSEQKQMVLDNLKDYAVRALVNAVDHLGTVAYKLTDLLEQQTSDVSTMELKVTSLNQQLLTCQTYTDKEGIRQQELLAIVPRHHKRYVLPNLINKKVHFSPNVQNDPRQTHVQARPRVHPSASPSAKTLSWHLASETKPSLKGSQKSSTCSEGQRNSLESSGEFDFIGNEPGIGKKSSSTHSERSAGSRSPLSSIIRQPFGNTHKETSLDSRSLTPFRSFETPTTQAIVRAPSRGKGVLSSLFVKQKVPKLKAGAVA